MAIINIIKSKWTPKRIALYCKRPFIFTAVAVAAAAASERGRCCPSLSICGWPEDEVCNAPKRTVNMCLGNLAIPLILRNVRIYLTSFPSRQRQRHSLVHFVFRVQSVWMTECANMFTCLSICLSEKWVANAHTHTHKHSCCSQPREPIYKRAAKRTSILRVSTLFILMHNNNEGNGFRPPLVLVWPPFGHEKRNSPGHRLMNIMLRDNNKLGKHNKHFLAEAIFHNLMLINFFSFSIIVWRSFATVNMVHVHNLCVTRIWIPDPKRNQNNAVSPCGVLRSP